MTTKEALTVAEAAEYLGLSRNTVYAMVDGGQLPHRRTGANGSKRGRILIGRKALDKWLEGEGGSAA